MDINKLPPWDSNLHYYKAVFEIDDVSFIWHEDIFAQNLDMSCDFSGIIKLTPITKEEGETLFANYKNYGYGDLVYTKKQSKYIYNKYQVFQYSISHEPFLICDAREKLEKMTWRTALYLAYNIFADRRCNSSLLPPKITGNKQPFYNIQSHSVLPDGEVTLYIDGTTKNGSINWKNKKIYFLQRRSFAKTGYVSKFKEYFYYTYIVGKPESILHLSELYRKYDTPSTYKFSQMWASKCENQSSSSEIEISSESEMSDSSVDGNNKSCYQFDIPGYEYVYALYQDNYVTNIDCGYEEIYLETGNGVERQLIPRCLNNQNYYTLTGSKFLNEFQLFTYYVTGGGLVKFLEISNNENKNLVYPFDSLPLTYSGLKVVGSQQYLNLNSVLQDVYRTVVYKCKPCMTESSSSSESSSESSSSSSIYHGGEGSGGSSSSSNTPTGTAAFQNAMKNLKSFTVPNGGFIRGT